MILRVGVVIDFRLILFVLQIVLFVTICVSRQGFDSQKLFPNNQPNRIGCKRRWYDGIRIRCCESEWIEYSRRNRICYGLYFRNTIHNVHCHKLTTIWIVLTIQPKITIPSRRAIRSKLNYFILIYFNRPNNVTRSESKVILLDNTHGQEKHQEQLSQSTRKK